MDDKISWNVPRCVVRLDLSEDTVRVSSGLPADAQARKAIPVVTGVLDYFPDAIAAIAECSKAGNDQHNPGQPLHWDKSKSADHADCIGRHLIQRGTLDTDGQRHSAKVAWRALALLQIEIEAERSGRVTPDVDDNTWVQLFGSEVKP